MATAFKRKGSRIVARFDDTEREIVRQLLEQTRQLVAPEDDEHEDPVEALLAGIGDSPDPQELADRDPALARLLPDGNRDDPELAREFRALTEHSLRRRKAATLRTAIEALGGDSGDRLELDLGQAQALLVGLADVRLALGERLELRTDEDSETLQRDLAEAGDRVGDDPRLVIGLYYDFLTWMQESLSGALMR